MSDERGLMQSDAWEMTAEEDAREAAMTGAPLQLELFREGPPRRVLTDAKGAAAAVSEALGQGRTVGLLPAPNGFELVVAPKDDGRQLELALPLKWSRPCGFSKRAVELLVRGVEHEERGLWARPAGGAWAGWAEWGTLLGPKLQ